ncbi:uncharacterized protein DNG_03741 [Cephalotrichum gorgonifer]|uniref:Cerato-platanin n=1 Tax=Cephalotrichum gorgonifer TaxID=2041049 RepID=A0AAE8MWR4_9PEZI|nr:uncharacterized protein DNG_03741 [Cephalotrichum gorgonifer]
MRPTLPFSLMASALGAFAQTSKSGSVWVTPHEQYSSSVGVLGCLVDSNRIAYWPASVDCDNICVRLSHEGREVYLLRVDQSQGAYDVSYDAWNYLYTGKSASKAPAVGGPVAMDFETVDADKCKDLIHTDGHKLPLSASNSMNYLASCLADEDSWVAQNYVLYNILDPICSMGTKEKCPLDWPAANQASCPSGLGVPSVLEGEAVYNIQYGTGKMVSSQTNLVVNDAPSSAQAAAPGGMYVRYTKPGFSAAHVAKRTVSAGERQLYKVDNHPSQSPCLIVADSDFMRA